MGCRYHAFKANGIRKIGNRRSKITQFKTNLNNGIDKNFNPLNILKHLLFFILLFFCFVASGYAIDITLEWAPNNESSLAGYTVYYRQEGQSYNYAEPYWETTESICTIYDLDETQTYYFVVRAFSTVGFQSGDSNEVCFKAGKITSN